MFRFSSHNNNKTCTFLIVVVVVVWWSVTTTSRDTTLPHVFALSSSSSSLRPPPSSSRPHTQRRQPRNIESLLDWAVSNGVIIHDQVDLVSSTAAAATSSNSSNTVDTKDNQRNTPNRQQPPLKVEDNDDDIAWGIRTTTTSLSLNKGDVLLRVPQHLIWNAGRIYEELYHELKNPASTAAIRRPSSDDDNDNIMPLSSTTVVTAADTSTDKMISQQHHPLVQVVKQLQSLAAVKDYLGEFILFLNLLKVKYQYNSNKAAKEPTTTSTALDTDPPTTTHKSSSSSSSTKWQPWIDSLPSTFINALSFTPEQMDCLPTYTKALAQYEHVKCELFYHCFQNLQAALSQNTTPSSLWLQHNYSQKDIEWAYSVVFSRCWKQQQPQPPQHHDEMNLLQEESISQPKKNDDDRSSVKAALNKDDWSYTDLVPMGDLFNHRNPANVIAIPTANTTTIDFVYTDDDNTQTHNRNTGSSSSNTFLLYLSYGVCSNPHRFLTIFGFVDTSMKEVWSQLVFPNPDRYLVALGCTDQQRMVVRTIDGAVASTVWDCVLYALLVALEHQQTFAAATTTSAGTTTADSSDPKATASVQSLLEPMHNNAALPSSTSTPLSQRFYRACMRARQQPKPSRQQESPSAESRDILHTDDDDKLVRVQLHATYKVQATTIVRNHMRRLLDELQMLRSERIVPLVENAAGSSASTTSLDLINRHNSFLTEVYRRVLENLE